MLVLQLNIWGLCELMRAYIHEFFHCCFTYLFFFFFRKAWIDQRFTRGWSGEKIRISSSLNILNKKHGSDHLAFNSKPAEECRVFVPFLYSYNPTLSAMRVDSFLTCTTNFFWFITFLKAVAVFYLLVTCLLIGLGPSMFLQDDAYNLIFLNNNWYLLFRLHQVNHCYTERCCSFISSCRF